MADPLPPDLLALIEDYETSIETIRDRVTAYALATWEALDDRHDDTIEGWIRAIAPIVTGGQQLTGTLTANYLAAYGALLEFESEAAIIPADTMTTQALRGEDDQTLYRRPAYEFWKQVGAGDPEAVAVVAGGIRLSQLVTTNLQLARTHAARRAMSTSAVIIGYRRLISGLACSLCTDTTRRFSTHELMPIHTNCRCGIVPVYKGGPDPGAVSLGPPGDDRGESRIVQHGEVGPMLVAEGDHYTPTQ